LADLLQIVADQDADVHEEPRPDLPAIEGYELLSKIGEGGMGIVYRARQVSLRRTVAVKVLRDELAGDEAFITRFMREARLAAALGHPNIVRAIDVGRCGKTYYFAMEFVDGEAVKAIMNREGVLPERRATEIALHVARALEYARTEGLIHRDVKPDNILIDREGAAMLADMGLARLASAGTSGRAAGGTQITQAATMMGTPDYISPEQARCQEDIDTRTDVYALGATFFHMLAGRPPFTGESQADVISKHLNEPPPLADEVNPKVGAGAGLVARKAMEKKRNDRYETPGQMASDLDDLLRGEPPRIASRGMPPGTAAPTPSARKWIGFAAVCALVLLTSGGRLLARRARDARAQAAREALLTQARESILRGDHETAVGLLAEVRTQGPDAEVERLLVRARLTKHLSAARAFEDEGDIAAAVTEYELAFRIERNESLNSRVADLRRRAELADALAAGDRLLGDEDRGGALSAYRASLPLALGGEKAEIAARIDAVERRVRCDEAMAAARAALAASEWDEAMARGEAALVSVPGDKDALALVASARNSQAEESERLRSLIAYAEASDKARRALENREWDEAVARAEEALSFVTEPSAASEIRALARRAREEKEEERKLEELRERERIERERKRKAHAEEATEAKRASRAGDWQRAAESARAALSIRPEDETAAGLLRLAEAELSRERQITNSIGMTLVLVPAGEFVMGSREGEDGEPDERPARKAHLDAYYVGKYEVTNTQFEVFRPAHLAKSRVYSPTDEMPAVCVSWADAAAFCEWLSAKEGEEYRLPTEAEWEKAARGTDARTYPWGEAAPDAEGVFRANFAPGADRATWSDDGYEFAASVGSFAGSASPCGALDMAGNVWEWCLDWYAPGNANRTARSPEGPTGGGKRVLRGGSFTTGAAALRAANRAAHVPEFHDASVGFRCVMIPERRPMRE
jgi:serine/threonine-protein kinase